MTWNYRVVENLNKYNETFFEIKEIYCHLPTTKDRGLVGSN